MSTAVGPAQGVSVPATKEFSRTSRRGVTLRGAVDYDKQCWIFGLGATRNRTPSIWGIALGLGPYAVTIEVGRI